MISGAQVEAMLGSLDKEALPILEVFKECIDLKENSHHLGDMPPPAIDMKVPVIAVSSSFLFNCAIVRNISGPAVMCWGI